MKDKKVVITDKAIYLEENERSIVMDSASKKLMEMYSYIVCQNKGNVLDVGFGMGYSANKMYELADSYTCIEINPTLYRRACEWAKGKSNVNIIFGDWFEVIPQLNLKYDGIFMDTHDDPNYNSFEQAAKAVAEEGCILSIFNYFSLRDTNELNNYEYKLEPGKFSKVVTPIHSIYWTYFNSGVWNRKKSNKIKFPEPKNVI